jgi:hypothetical protein
MAPERPSYNPDQNHVSRGETPGEHKDWNWELFDTNPEEWFRQRHPEWTEEKIQQAVRENEHIGLIEQYEQQRKEIKRLKKKLKRKH